MKKPTHKQVLLDAISAIGETECVGKIKTYRGYQEVYVKFLGHPCVFRFTRSWNPDGSTRMYSADRYDSDGDGWVNVSGPFVGQYFECPTRKKLADWAHEVWDRDDQRHFDFTQEGVACISFLGTVA